METIYEQKIESPVMMGHGKHVANTGRPVASVSPLSPAESTSSQSPTSPSLAKRPNQIMCDWVKRSGSGPERPTKHIAHLVSASHQRLPIVHLGGGRLGESDIEPAFPTGLRPRARNPSIQRESSADSRVTQWIDLYPEAIERMNGYDARLTQGKHTRTVSESSTIKQTRWKFHPDHHAAAPPEIDARPAPLRIPSAKKKNADDDALKRSTRSKTTTLSRSDSKWKPLPILPAQQQVAAGANQHKLGNPGVGKGIPARKPLQAPPAEHAYREDRLPESKGSDDSITRPQTPKRQQTNPVPTKKPESIPPLPLAIYVTPPPTPDSDTQPIAKIEITSGPPALRIDTGARIPSPPSTVSLAPDAVPKPQVAFELAATEPTTLRPSLISQSDSLLSADLDDAFKITIGMMCMNELDLNLGGSVSPSHEDQSGKKLAEQPTSKNVPLDSPSLSADLDSPLAYVPRLFSPRGCSPVGEVFAKSLALEKTIKNAEVQEDSRRQELKPTVVVAAPSQSPDHATLVSPSTTTTTLATAAATTKTVPRSNSRGSKVPIRPCSPLALKSPPPIIPQTCQDKLATPPPQSTTSRYTRAERTWLHQHYRGEAPFLRAWGLDIKSPADRDEGMAILRDLMLSDL